MGKIIKDLFKMYLGFFIISNIFPAKEIKIETKVETTRKIAFECKRAYLIASQLTNENKTLKDKAHQYERFWWSVSDETRENWLNNEIYQKR